MERQPLYLCDPEKNRECPKTGCAHNSFAMHPFCEATTHPEFAKLDEQGKPIQMPSLLDMFIAEEKECEGL